MQLADVQPGGRGGESFALSRERLNARRPNVRVIQVFITPGVDDSAHYIELEVSPFNAMVRAADVLWWFTVRRRCKPLLCPGFRLQYLARITNQYLNGSVLNHTMIDCGSSGVKHWTVPSSYDHSFTAQVQLPWSLVSNVTAQGPPSTVWRVNFFRVLMLEATDFCTPQECSYGAWSPTFVWPPAFHHSAYFGVLVLA